MQRQDKKQDYKVELINISDEILEVRYFDNRKDECYLSWKIPRVVIKELILWWKRLVESKSKKLPIKEKKKICEFNMSTDKCINIREFDNFGRYKIIGWSFSSVVMEKLIDWSWDK